MRTQRVFFIGLIFIGLLSGQNCRAAAEEKDRLVLDLFKEISAVPRCFMYERNMGVWLRQWARKNGFASEGDAAGNVVIRVPAGKGYEKAPVIVLQSHMDMVCEKSSGSRHDFFKDPIRVIQEGEWLRADQTTLGADDGIGMALALAAAKNSADPHPALELLFTTGEESGFRGAAALDESWLKSRMCINLDSETEGTLTVGSAGGLTTAVTLAAKSEKLPKSWGVYTLKVNGLQGGHSGADIHLKRGNALKLLAKALEVAGSNAEIRLIELKGGSRVNAIPRQAAALLAFSSDRFEIIRKKLEDLELILRQEHSLADKDLSIQIELLKSPRPAAGFTFTDSSRIIALLGVLPNGVAKMDPRFPGSVETSNNLGLLESTAGSVGIVSNQRSSSLSGLAEITNRIKKTGAAAGAAVSDQNGYAPWQADPNSMLLKRAKEVYRKLFGQEPKVVVVHGGLECGVLAAKFRNMDIISMGPMIEGAHSPVECLHIPSVGKVRAWLAGLLASFK